MKIPDGMLGLSPIARSLVAATVAALFACGPKDNGPKYPDLNSFCNARATAECSPKVLLVCAIPTTSSSVCVDKRSQICRSNPPPPGTVYNSGAAEACISQVSSAYADAVLSLDESNAIAAACAAVFDGTSGLNAACQSDSTCKLSSSLRCVLSAGSTSGTCQVPMPVGGGEPCSSASAQCIAGFHCGATAHCDADVAVNGTCGDTQPCGKGLQCSSAMICVAKSDDGTVCSTGDECLHGICNKAIGSAMGVCVSEVTLQADVPFCVESRP